MRPADGVGREPPELPSPPGSRPPPDSGHSHRRSVRHGCIEGRQTPWLQIPDTWRIKGAIIAVLPVSCFCGGHWAGLDQDHFGSNRPKVINLIDSNKIEHDYFRKVFTLFGYSGGSPTASVSAAPRDFAPGDNPIEPAVAPATGRHGPACGRLRRWPRSRPSPVCSHAAPAYRSGQ